MPGGKDTASGKQLIYRRGEYLALRTEDDGYYICQTLQHVFTESIRFKILWLSELARQADTYVTDYIDYSEPDCIITHLRLNKVDKDTYKLPENQKAKIKRHLKEALEPDESDDNEEEDEEVEGKEEESEADSDEEESEEADGGDVEEGESESEDSDGEPKQKKARKAPAKQTKGASKSRPKPRVKATAKSTAGKAGKKKAAPSKAKKKPAAKKSETKKGKKDDKPEKPKKRRLTPEERANPNLLLVANTKVKIWDKNPLTHSNEKVPFISSSAHSKLVFRAVALNDMKLLQSLIDNVKNVYRVDPCFSLAIDDTPITWAVKAENHKALQLLMKEVYDRESKKPQRCQAPRSLLQTVSTGKYNRFSLGIPAVRAVSMSRGSKEGNNALTKDSYLSRSYNVHDYLNAALKKGVSKKTLDVMLSASKMMGNEYMIDNNIHAAIRTGNRKLAATLIEGSLKRGSNSFNVLAKEVLQFDKEELRKTSLREPSIRKKAWDNLNITPLHCAAINPNVKYMSKLFSVLPEYSINDRNNRRPIHYAAACEGTGPLEYLLTRGVDPDEADSSGYTPLMVACEVGRVHNVDLLLNRAKAAASKAEDMDDEDEENEEDEEEEEEPKRANVDKYGVGGIDRPVQKPNQHFSYCPIHIAIESNRIDVVKSLIKHGADIHKLLSASQNKMTPFMVAAKAGNLELVKLLFKAKARVEQKDKLQRTALIHAVMNGHAHIASYLLSLGADPNAADSSGNTCVHYAAAYGWYFCVKVLVEAGADPVVSNTWQVAPLGIAFLKGHLGIVDYLLQQPGIDINFRDDQGKTLVALACASPLTKGLADEVAYLVDKKGADCTIVDISGNTPLHHLATNSIMTSGWKPTIDQVAVAESLRIGKLLLAHGTSGADKNGEGLTPVLFAIEQGNTDLVRLLMEKGGEISAATNDEGKNALHLMAEKCMTSNLGPLVEILHRSLQKGGSTKHSGNVLHQMAAAVDKEGFTPLLLACQAYSGWEGSTEEEGSVGSSEEDEEEEEEEEIEEDDDDSDYDSSGGGGRGRKRKAASRSTRVQNKKAKKDTGSKAEKKDDKSWEQGRRFISVLLEHCNADPKVAVQEKTFTKAEGTPSKKEDRYADPSLAKNTPLHFLVAASSEPPLQNKNSEVENHCPVLALLLRRLKAEDVEPRNLAGSTPLIDCLKLATPRAMDFAKKLIKHGADCNLRSHVKSDYKAAPLAIAISHDCPIDMIEVLLPKSDIHLHNTRDQNTALHLAVTRDRGDVDVIRLADLLLRAGAPVNAVNSKGRTPLHMAVSSNSGGSDTTSELESVLIEQHGADVRARDSRGRLPLHYVFTKIGHYNDTSRSDPIELCTTLTSLMSSVDIADNRGQTPLHLAARCGAGVCCTHLVQKKCNINARDKAGNTPLTLAAIHGHESCAIMLIQKNASISATAVYVTPPEDEKDNRREDKDEDEEDEEEDEDEEEGKNEEEAEENEDDDEADSKEVDSEDESKQLKPNPWVWRLHRKKPYEPKRFPVFQVCVKNDWPGVIYMMLDVLDDTTITINTAIEAALNTGRYNLALTLIRKFKDDRKLRETNRATGRTLLHTLAVMATAGSQEDLLLRLAGELVRRGVPLNSKDHSGCKPLHYAALRHNTPLVKFILEKVHDVDVNESDRFGRTPLAAAFWSLQQDTCSEVYEELFNQGATLNDQYSFPDLPIFFGKVPKDDRTLSEIEAEYVTEQKSVRCTPLIRAIQMQNFEVTKQLLRDGADPNARDSLQRVPLVHAIRRNNIHIVKLLLNYSYNLPKEDSVEIVHYTVSDPYQVGPGARRKKARPKGKAPRGRLFSLGRKMSEESQDDNEEDEEEPAPRKKETNDIDLSKFKLFRNVSGVRLTLRDQQGWSLIHHVVAPIEEATYDNVEMLKLLGDAGAPLAEKDMTGLTPLDYALRQNAPNLAKALQKLMGVGKTHWDKPTLRSQPSLSDGLSWSSPRPNFSADAEAFIAKIEEEEDADEDDQPRPDEKLDMEDNGEVETDTEQDVPYDVTLTKVDVKGNYGMGIYNFYVMQVVKHKAKDLWILFTRWGRIGDDGQFQRTPFSTKDEACKEFAKVFRSKTGNNWSNVRSFEHQPKKYRLVEQEKRSRSKTLKSVPFTLKTTLPSQLPDHLRAIIEEFASTNLLTKAYEEAEVDENTVPFSRISKESISKAVAALNNLAPIVDEISNIKTPIEDTDAYKALLEKAAAFSNEVYQLVPIMRYAYSAIRVIDNASMVQQELQRLTNLSELELAARILAGASHRRLDIHPADYIYRSLGTTLRLMNPDEIETQHLLKYIDTGSVTSSHYGTKVKIEAIYEVNRPGETQRINKLHLDNHKLLFHGTRTSNLISILNRGLLIAPPGALVTGHLFGKGIYTTDMFCKSVDYCQNWESKSKNKFILICQVALGESQVLHTIPTLKLPDTFESRLAPGSQGPRSSHDVKLRDGCVLPLGDEIKRKGSSDVWWMPEHSEYVVFNADQVKMRYLVKFK